jgi:cytochrome c-type biogenesis protein CcsB
LDEVFRLIDFKFWNSLVILPTKKKKDGDVNLIRIFFFICFIFFSNTVFSTPGELIRSLPVQDGGRIKPYDSFAKETLELIYGKSKYKRQVTESNSVQKSEPAYLIVLSFILAPESWLKIPLFEVTHLDIKNKLKLDLDQKHFTGAQIFQNENFPNLMQELSDQRESKEKLTPYFQALQRLENQLYVFRELSAGRLLKIIPNKNSSNWTAIAELPENIQPYFIDMSQNFAKHLGEIADNFENKKNETLYAKAFDDSVQKFVTMATKDFPEEYSYASKAGAEVFYNDVHLFRWTYVIYLMSALVLLFSWIKASSQYSGPAMKTAWFLSSFGFLLHTSGFLFRIYLAERPPVTNMYETVIWMSWGAVLFSVILEKIYKFKFILFAGMLVGICAMIVADNVPAVLDPSIQPLEAVLRSNYWLIIHVMTICISYSAFALAWCLGNMGLVYYLIGEAQHRETIQKTATAIYRSIQIGVAFLTPGIILGGIWADYSWGRFWGWDPKETWALIALMGYIIVLHAKLIQWLQNFGVIVSSVLAFSLVIMAWYGVNFVLGAGLHSYGFGAGGVEYVAAALAIQMIFILYVSVVRYSGNKNKAA